MEFKLCLRLEFFWGGRRA